MYDSIDENNMISIYCEQLSRLFFSNGTQGFPACVKEFAAQRLFAVFSAFGWTQTRSEKSKHLFKAAYSFLLQSSIYGLYRYKDEQHRRLLDFLSMSLLVRSEGRMQGRACCFVHVKLPHCMWCTGQSERCIMKLGQILETVLHASW